jgi:hypothetical protein
MAYRPQVALTGPGSARPRSTGGSADHISEAALSRNQKAAIAPMP